VIVTGGSRGIGRSVVEAMAAEGADLVVNYAGNHQAAGEAQRAVEAAGRRCVLVPGSVADPETAPRLVRAALDAFGRVDVLVNNAGVGRDGPLLMLPDKAWRDMLAINLHGMFRCCQAVIGPMAERGGGAIVNMSSTSGRRGRAGHVAYAATKGAVIGLTASLAEELGPLGIRVNAVAPGFVATRWMKNLLGEKRYNERVIEQAKITPVGKTAYAEDIAEMVCWFIDGPDLITGEVLPIDYGTRFGKLPAN
jgi:3-oxoacyl-[acyl-carrier protein] reductase